MNPPNKLNLILDLDHTLLHTTRLSYLTPEEQYLINNPTNPHQDVFVFEDVDVTKLTKLRPSVGTFLDEASKIFELHIYTKGNRRYANRMATFLDPNREYFASSSRVISCEDHGIVGGYKNLDAAEGCKCSNSLIVDDTISAWSNDNRSNMIFVDRYYFFKGQQKKGKSYAELKTDEVGFLDDVLQLLKMLNRIYCDALTRNPSGVDVRDVFRCFKNCDASILK